MPVFHTKTIESILEPVAQQVSRLVILHEEAEDGNPMPDLSRPVDAVSKAVANLVHVGRDTINSSDDAILRQEMPSSLQRVNGASKLLEEASSMLLVDNLSIPARRKLIEGARGILQGTSGLLLCFDESEVRKMVQECNKVLSLLGQTDYIMTMEQLVSFVKDLSPTLTRVSRDVDGRILELTHVMHRDLLSNHLNQVKTLAPILICALKVRVQLQTTSPKVNLSEALENGSFLHNRMNMSVREMIRVLQLTSHEDDPDFISGNYPDAIAYLKNLEASMKEKMPGSLLWLNSPELGTHHPGRKDLRSLLDSATRVADKGANPHRHDLIRTINDLETNLKRVDEFRNRGCGSDPDCINTCNYMSNRLQDLMAGTHTTIGATMRAIPQQVGNTLSQRIEQALRWVEDPLVNDKGLGANALHSVTQEATQIAAMTPASQRQDLLNQSNAVNEGCNRMVQMTSNGDFICPGPRENDLRKGLIRNIHKLVDGVRDALVHRVVLDFVDVTTPLKQFTEAVLTPEGTPGREGNFEEKAQELLSFGHKISATGSAVSSGCCDQRRLFEALSQASDELSCMTPQLIAAARIRFNHPDNRSADEHFENLRRTFGDLVQQVRSLVDEAVDTLAFVIASEEQIRRHGALTEHAIQTNAPQPMVQHASAIARLANRVLMVAKQEAENSEDPVYVAKLNRAIEQLHASIAPMVMAAKAAAGNLNDSRLAKRWAETFADLLKGVMAVRTALTPSPGSDRSRSGAGAGGAGDLLKPLNDLDLGAGYGGKGAPIRPPLPSGDLYPGPYGTSSSGPARPPLPTGLHGTHGHEDEEDEMDRFPVLMPNQPIMAAAHALHQEVRHWSSKDNEIIAAAKKMALLMARLSQLVRGEGGTKKDLIACAKAIAEASEEVTRLAKEQAKLCTDKRMRTNILQVCERIPTIGTQLRILSTVKATMLGAQGSDEDQEATDMLVGNAQNLMQSVKETVRACESASIKIRTDAGAKCIWTRKEPWYQA